MPRICKISFPIFLLVAAKIAAVAGVSVLVVGNSLTQANDLPTVFKRFAAQAALHVDVDVNSITPGGAFLYDHWRSGVALGRLRELQPNFLILQGQSIEPLLAPRKFNYYAFSKRTLTVFPRRLFCFQPGRDRPAIRTIKTLPRADLPPKCKRD